jgi:hypothetical protein
VDAVGRILAGPLASQARSSSLRSKLGKLTSPVDVTVAPEELIDGHYHKAQLISAHVWRLTTKSLAKSQGNWTSIRQRDVSKLKREILDNRSSPMLLDLLERPDSEMIWSSLGIQDLQLGIESNAAMMELQ